MSVRAPIVWSVVCLLVFWLPLGYVVWWLW